MALTRRIREIESMIAELTELIEKERLWVKALERELNRARLRERTLAQRKRILKKELRRLNRGQAREWDNIGTIIDEVLKR